MKMISAFLLRILLLAALGYLFICFYIFLRQRSMLYHPQAIPEGEMEQLAESVGMSRWLDKSGNPLGWMTRDGMADAIPALIFHGNAGNALGRLHLIGRLRGAGADGRIYVLDYPGYGSAPGSPSQASLTGAAVRALDSLPGRVVVIGESLGTGVAAQAATKRPEKIQGIILITPFESMVVAASHHYPWLPVPLLLLDRFDSGAALRKMPRPIAILLAREDDTTPPETGRRLFTALTGSKKLWEVEGAGHNDVVDKLSDEEWRKVWDFVTRNPR